jgi:Rifampin ADP-ribosyl transferase
MRTKYFHGGNRKLHVGDYVLPQSETGVVGMSHPLCRKDRVYVTPSIIDAEFYASGAADPVVYVVIPEGDVEPDPDCNRLGGSFACPRAKVIAIRKIPGKVIKKNKKAMLQRAHQLVDQT